MILRKSLIGSFFVHIRPVQAQIPIKSYLKIPLQSDKTLIQTPNRKLNLLQTFQRI